MTLKFARFLVVLAALVFVTSYLAMFFFLTLPSPTLVLILLGCPLVVLVGLVGSVVDADKVFQGK